MTNACNLAFAQSASQFSIKTTMKHSFIKGAASVFVLASGTLVGNVSAQTAAATNSAAYNKDPWVNALIKKGIFTQDEANQIASEIAAGKTLTIRRTSIPP